MSQYASLKDALLTCCASERWASEMERRAPFASEKACLSMSNQVWCGLARVDWLQAFAAHPKIGDVDALRTKFAGTGFGKLSEGEQQGVDGALEATLQGLKSGNERYLDKFGYIFIVCATGKTADEMLALLNARVGNADATELPLAAAEQDKITTIRLGAMAAKGSVCGVRLIDTTLPF